MCIAFRMLRGPNWARIIHRGLLEDSFSIWYRGSVVAYSPLALNSYTHLIHTTLDFPCYYFHSLNSYTHLIHTPPSDNSYVFSGAARDFFGFQSGGTDVTYRGELSSSQLKVNNILHHLSEVTRTDTDGTREVGPNIWYFMITRIYALGFSAKRKWHNWYSENPCNPTFHSLNWYTHLIDTLAILGAPIHLIDKYQLSARAL